MLTVERIAAIRPVGEVGGRERAGDDPGAIDGYLAGLQLTIPGTDAAGHVPLLLAVAERLTGLRMAPEWLDQQYLLVPLPEWLQPLPPRG